jgi:hypothetical protein
MMKKSNKIKKLYKEKKINKLNLRDKNLLNVKILLIKNIKFTLKQKIYNL